MHGKRGEGGGEANSGEEEGRPDIVTSREVVSYHVTGLESGLAMLKMEATYPLLDEPKRVVHQPASACPAHPTHHRYQISIPQTPSSPQTPLSFSPPFTLVLPLSSLPALPPSFSFPFFLPPCFHPPSFQAVLTRRPCRSRRAPAR